MAVISLHLFLVSYLVNWQRGRAEALNREVLRLSACNSIVKWYYSTARPMSTRMQGLQRSAEGEAASEA